MKHILMVDDVTLNLKYAAEVLKDTYQITTAKSGKQALAILNELRPDLIILDINMPEMDGYEVMERIRQIPDLEAIPVVFLTAKTDRESEARGLEMGAVDYIKKPFEPDDMHARIDKAILMSAKEGEAEEAGGIDELTALHDQKYLEQYLKSIDNGKAAAGFFLLLDLDDFKVVNENYGRIIGDSVLVRLSKVLQEVIGEENCVCRVGGDSFAAFVRDQSEKSKIKSLVRRLIAEAEFEINELLSYPSDFKASISIGVSQRPEDGNTFQELYADADKALYFVKQNGKRGYHFYQDTAADGGDIRDENNLIDLMQLQRLIQEKEEKSGVYMMEYDDFKRIYRFVSRCMERKSQNVQLVLFTIVNEKGEDGAEIQLNAAKALEDAVSISLRKGDVATKCGNIQYVVILMNASYENGDMVARRIRKKFEELLKEEGVTLSYEMQTVATASDAAL